MHYEHLPANTEAMVRTIAMPKDTNALGDIFGGWLMSNADIAAAIQAFKRAGGRAVTVAVNNFIFHNPVYVGDVVSFYANVDGVGNTSMTIDVTAFSTRSHNGDEQTVRVATATMTYVRIDDNGRPCPIQTLSH